VAWSRILDDEEMLCLFNSHGGKSRRADVLMDAVLNGQEGKGALTMVFNSAHEAKWPERYSETYHIGSKQTVKGRHGMAMCRSGILHHPMCWGWLRTRRRRWGWWYRQSDLGIRVAKVKTK